MIIWDQIIWIYLRKNLYVVAFGSNKCSWEKIIKRPNQNNMVHYLNIYPPGHKRKLNKRTSSEWFLCVQITFCVPEVWFLNH